MALSEKFLTLEGVTNIAQAGSNAINKLIAAEASNDGTIKDTLQRIINDISNVIKNIKDETNLFLKIMGCSNVESGGMEQFRQRLTQFYEDSKATSLFLGSNIHRIIRGYNMINDETAQLQERYVKNFMDNFLREETNKDIRDMLKTGTEEKIADNVAKRIMSALGQEIKAGSGEIKNTSSITALKYEKGELKIIVDDLTKVQKRRLKQKVTNLRNGMETLPKGQEHLLDDLKGFVESTDQLTILGFIWGKTTNNQTTKEVKSQEERAKYNETIIDAIASQVDGRYRNMARRIMKNMATNEKYGQDGMFLVGQSDTQIIGILGEISAAIALYNLLGNKVSWQKIIEWTAKYTSHGKQLSIDFAINELTNAKIKKRVGVQVKNTGKDLAADINKTLRIEFGKGQIAEVFNRLNIDDEALIESLESDVFNVPFKLQGNKYIEVSNNSNFSHDPKEYSRFRQFIGLDFQIRKVAEKINIFLMQFAPDFLYMSKGDGIENKLATLERTFKNGQTDLFKGNAVYMVGNKVEFAIEMLQDFQEDLRLLQEAYDEYELNTKQQHFMLETYFEDGQNTAQYSNIVAYKNSNEPIERLASYKTKIKSSWGFDR